MKSLLLVLSLNLIATSICWGFSIEEKFKSLVSSIEAEINLYGGQEDKIDQLANGGLRQSLFSIQTLANLFSTKYPSLSEIHSSSKQLEDSIGAYRKTVEQYNYAEAAGKSPEILEGLNEKKNFMRNELISFLASSGWVQGTASQRLKTVLAATNWESASTDQKFSYSALAGQVRQIDLTDWNMDVLEGGGIHDLRKAVRWYNLEVKALNDLIGFQEATCGEGAILPTDPNSGGKCLISSCHHSQMLNIYDVFGSIKDIGEGQEGIGGHIPPEKLQEAAQLYQDTRNKETFKKLSEELNSCAQALSEAEGEKK